MRILITLTMILLCHFVALAQSFSVLEIPGKVYGSLESEIRTSIRIKNNGSAPLLLGVKIVNKETGLDESVFFCWKKDCSMPASNPTLENKINTGSIYDGFTSVLKSGRSENKSSVKYLFYNVFDPTDSVSVKINYLIGSKGNSNFMFSTPDLMVSNFYPNPASNQVSLDYSLADNKTKVKILIQNVLGGIVDEHLLSTSEIKLKINTSELKPGVYFYTLLVDNKSIVTKKIIIKK